MQRRRLLGAAGVSLAGASSPSIAVAQGVFATPPPLVPIQARPDRIVALTVCTRPFRAQGPRIEAQTIGRQTVIHNYGHGGSGWSLSWGSAALAVRLALATGERRIAVIGCGAIGLTTARVAQRAGLRVRIVCRDEPPDVRSAGATGVWSPDSRICTEDNATPAFRRRWEAMARQSHRMFQSLLGLPGEPVEWRDGYALSDVPFDQPAPGAADDGEPAEPDYPDLEGELLADLRPRSLPLAPGEHPFPVAHVRRYAQMVFNLSGYTQLLLDDVLRRGATIEHRDFASPRQFAALPERTLVNATGYGARALLGDESIVPVRGQVARLIPQPEVRYGLSWRGHNLFVVSRRDGIVVQAQGSSDFGNADTAPDRAQSDAAVRRLASLFAGR